MPIFGHWGGATVKTLGCPDETTLEPLSPLRLTSSFQDNFMVTDDSATVFRGINFVAPRSRKIRLNIPAIISRVER